MQNRWILIKNQEIKEFHINHWLFSGQELVDLLKEVGFTKINNYGDLSGSPYDHMARRLVGVAEK